MQIQYQKHFSHSLHRDMEYKVYGHGGKPVLYIPCQGGRFFDFEDFHMLDHWAGWIESGKCRVFSVDTIDNSAWAAVGEDPARRIALHEQWYHYVTDELCSLIRQSTGREDIMAFGCSMGGMHAANLFFRRPDLFDSVLAISGVYDSLDYFDDYMDALLYDNCPVYYLANMPWDHPYLEIYRHRKMRIVVGQGAWEAPQVAGTRRLEAVLRQKNIPAQVEYWGYDVDHDWPWWYRMCQVYVPEYLDQG